MKLGTKFVGRQPRELLVPFLVGSGIIQLMLLMTIGGLKMEISQIQKTGAPTLVELADGRSITVRALGHYEREPIAIQRFVADTFTMMLDWNGRLPPKTIAEAKNPPPDQGVGIPGSQNKISTGAWMAGFAVSDDFRAAFLQSLAEITPQEIFKDGNQAGTQTALEIKEIPAPKKLGPGNWRVDMVAKLLIFKGGDNLGLKGAIPFDKSIYIRAVDTPDPVSNASPTQTAVYEARKAGLEIYQIKDLNLGD